MKYRILITVVLLLLAATLSSCKKKDEKEEEPGIVDCLPCGEAGGEVPYKPCHCEEYPVKPAEGVTNFSQGEAYLFRAGSISEQMTNKMNAERDSSIVCMIIYYSMDSAIMYINGRETANQRGGICNFPDFAKEWDIPETGCKVDVEGMMYIDCHYYGTLGHVPIIYLLTSLKRK